MGLGAKLIVASILVLLIIFSGCLENISFSAGPACGNLECEAGEDSTTCPQDCGVCTDPDGVNYFTAGTTIDGTGASIPDSCTNGVLTEGLCYQNLAYSFKRQCDTVCNPEGLAACEGTGSAVPAGQYCFAPNPENPVDPNLNYYLELNERTCHPTEGVEELWECATIETGANFSMIEDCSLRSPAEVCDAGVCVPAAVQQCPYACCSDAGCSDGQVCQNPGTASAQCVTDPTLVLYYNFNDSVAPVADLSGNGNTGTVSGATYDATGGLNGSGTYNFAVAGDYISAADSSTLRIPSSWTVSAWVNLSSWPAAVDKGLAIVAKGNSTETAGTNHNYLLGVENDVWGTGNATTAFLENTAGTNYTARSTGTLSLNAWHHLVGVYDDAANYVKIYVDGVFKTQTAANITADTGAPCVTIGRSQCDALAAWDTPLGRIDEVRIYKRAFTASEIDTLYKKGTCATPIACFSNEDCGTAATCSNPGVCGSAACVPCTPLCNADAECGAGQKCFNPNTCNAYCYTIDPNTVFYYDFADNFDGTATPVVPVNDITPNNNDSTPYASGILRTTQGKLGYGADLDGAAGWAAPPAVAALTSVAQAKTISMWIKADNTAAAQTLYEEGGTGKGTMLKISGNALYFYVDSASVPTTGSRSFINTAFTDTLNWHHIAGIFEGSEKMLYVDGFKVAYGTTGYSGIPSHTGEALGIGKTEGSDASLNTAANYFNGRIDDIMVVNKALSPLEIEKIYKQGNCATQIQCFANEDCGTAATCQNPGICGSAACQPCTLPCASDADCGTGKKCLNANTCNASCSIIDPDAVLYYDFTNNFIGSTVADLSGKGSTGTPSATGLAHTAGGIFGYGAEFDGFTGAITPANTNLKSSFTKKTISVWVKADTTSLSAQSLFEEGDSSNGIELLLTSAGVSLYAKNAGTLKFIGGNPSPAIDTTNWHHIVGVFDSGNMRIYIDNVLKFTGTATFTSIGAHTSAGAGMGKVNGTAAGSGSSFNYFNGRMDELRVINRALTAGEIAALYSNCPAECGSGAQCDDANPKTADTCNNPNTCTASCSHTLLCGNGVVDSGEAGEECDATSFEGKTCATYGYEAGTLACTTSCTIDTSGCSCTTPSACTSDADCQTGEHCLGACGKTCAAYAEQKTIGLGQVHSCIVLSNGTTKCWGSDYYGQLGDGTHTDSPVPVDASLLGTNVAMISAGNLYSCALATDGTLNCEGNNNAGQAADNPSANYSAVVSGNAHTCALLPLGGVECWGQNSYGQLGNGTNTGSTSPVAVQQITNAVSISSGEVHTCAVLSDGTVKCWGQNSKGQLGNSTTANSNVPVNVSGISNAVAVSASSNLTCALLSGGSVKCWGQGGYTGDGTATPNRLAPVQTSGITNAIAVAAGGTNTCAILASGEIKCWGQNIYGQLGDGTTTDSLVPVSVAGLPAAAAGISVGDLDHTCALLTDSTVWCWGRNHAGQLGDGTATNSSVPVNVVGIPPP